jgi:hypothetical protein
MSDAKLKNGERDAAIEFLNEAAVLAETVPQLTFRAAGYSEIGRRFAALGDGERAASAFSGSLNTISEIRDRSAQATALASLAPIVDENNYELEESLRSILRTITRKA